MEKAEIKEMIDYLDKVADQIPRGLAGLSDAVSFAMLDLIASYRHNIKTKAYDKALAFAKSIPKVKHFQTATFTSWMINDQEHLKYWD